ncbi:Piso0_001077 [Millerozyma farinosa CBS 7064]|uniref:Piso0_001077 protein n=1 Tax=Pichia sorbitophila (strain ATCC MYA-4447 / BCRC 22081 / CBS 7064 / NBRC 10061 / NRRL Y-12695) TaxID=559304 RepID=G8YSB7_PICSO|nr:Piso0_001077 [Millerozyma farinosa CBS 7064]CCE79040.1 Piso0_001077 [Millerozyma farinosa CBS 7064]
MRLGIIVYLIAGALGALVGIDYGQQNSKAVLLAPGSPFEIILTDEGKRKDVSGVFARIQGDELERVYGNAMGSLCTRFPQQCITKVKSLVGASAGSMAAGEAATSGFFKLVEDKNRLGGIKFDMGLGNESYNFALEEVLAMQLNQFKKRALRDLEHNSEAQAVADDVALSVPPFASQSARRAYLDALQLADFSNILGLVDEGTAVALNYVSNRKLEKRDLNDKKEYHLVYDMGAGSTKATLFSFTPFSNGTLLVDVESAGYDSGFGGDLLTQSIYSIIIEKLLAKFGVSHADEVPVKTKARILEAAEKAKTILSVNSDYHVSLENIYNDQDFKATITREEFEEINSDLMERITKPIYNAISNSDSVKDIGDIKSVILAGGSTRVPFVQSHIISLVGTEKISKNVNADESCAFGTTLRGLKLKTYIERSKGIKLIDRSINNFEINYDGKEFLVFPKGSVTNNITRIDLGKVPKTAVIDLYENGKLFKTIEVEDLKKASSLDCPSKTNKKLVATFSLDNNKIFDLKNLEVACDTSSTEGSDASQETAKAEEGKTNETNSSESSKPKARKPKAVSLSMKDSYPELAPLSKDTKTKFSKKLNYLEKRDRQRDELEKIKNVLEGKYYNIRGYIEDNEDAIIRELSEKELDEIKEYISNGIEWLEFDSDKSSYDHFVEKVKEVDEKKKYLENLFEMNSVDLSFQGIEKLQKDGGTIAMRIQDYLLKFGGEINELRKKFEAEGFNFEKENERTNQQVLRGGNDRLLSLEKNLAEYKDKLAKVTALVSNPKSFDKMVKRDVYEVYKEVTDKIVELLADLALIEGVQKSRLVALNEKFDQLMERKVKKQQREKAKKSKEAEKSSLKEKAAKTASAESSSETKTTSENEETHSEKEKDGSNETETSSSKSTETSVDHDEL